MRYFAKNLAHSRELLQENVTVVVEVSNDRNINVLIAQTPDNARDSRCPPREYSP